MKSKKYLQQLGFIYILAKSLTNTLPVKKAKIFFFRIFLFLITAMIFNSCNKNVSQINIAKVAGNYKGGSLDWSKQITSNSTSGTDPDFRFTVTYNPNKITLTIYTVSPISTKIFDLPLTSKSEIETSGEYLFEKWENNNAIHMFIVIGISTTQKGYAELRYSNTSSTLSESFHGKGSQQ